MVNQATFSKQDMIAQGDSSDEDPWKKLWQETRPYK